MPNQGIYNNGANLMAEKKTAKKVPALECIAPCRVTGVGSIELGSLIRSDKQQKAYQTIKSGTGIGKYFKEIEV